MEQIIIITITSILSYIGYRFKRKFLKEQKQIEYETNFWSKKSMELVFSTVTFDELLKEM